MSTLKVNSIIPVAGVPTGGGGGIIQIKQAVKTDTESHSVSSGGVSSLLSDLQPSITPTSSSSKILITVCLSLGTSGGGLCVSLFRDSTQIFLADSDGNRQRVSTGQTYENAHQLGNIHVTFLDSPSTTSATTYGLKLSHQSGSTQTMYVNRDNNNDNSSGRCRGASSVTVMEVSA